MEEVEEEVHVVHGLDALVDRIHDDGGVFSQLEGLSLLVPRPQLPELREQRDQLRVVLEQPGKRRTGLADALTNDLRQKQYSRKERHTCD